MKKTLLITMLAAVLSAPGAMADEAGDGKIAFGPQGGYVWPRLSINRPNANTENDNGFLAGAFLEFGVWVLTIRPEVNYVEKGYTVANTAEVTHKYLEIPALVKINPFGEFVVSPFLVFGPSWSKHLGSKTRLLGTTTSYNDNTDQWDAAGVAGAGIEFNVAENLGINVQGRYNFGIRDLDSSANEVRSRGLYGIVGVSIQD